MDLTTIDAEKLSLVGALALVITALLRGWMVPGWSYAELKADRDGWTKRYEVLAERALRHRPHAHESDPVVRT